jgi:dual specificity MAP kinase phosphatase
LLMAEKKCSLQEAYLELQIGRKRSFFVHSTDLPLLQKLQGKYQTSTHYGSLGRSNLGWSRNRDRDRWPWSSFGKTDHNSSPEKESSGSLGLRFGRRSSGPSSTREDQGNWLQNPKFDGSFPSRILSFLYLGNL